MKVVELDEMKDKKISKQWTVDIEHTCVCTGTVWINLNYDALYALHFLYAPGKLNIELDFFFGICQTAYTIIVRRQSLVV